MYKCLIFVFLAIASTRAFAPAAPAANRRQQSVSSLSMALVSPPPPPVVQNVAMDTTVTTTTTSPLTSGIDSFLAESPSSNLVALKERKVPTAEELAAKKRNFNLWFWGGGFVAPFLATFYYFGFKFWEK